MIWILSRSKTAPLKFFPPNYGEDQIEGDTASLHPDEPHPAEHCEFI